MVENQSGEGLCRNLTHKKIIDMNEKVRILDEQLQGMKFTGIVTLHYNCGGIVGAKIVREQVISLGIEVIIPRST